MKIKLRVTCYIEHDMESEPSQSNISKDLVISRYQRSIKAEIENWDGVVTSISCEEIP